jgi:prepilin-type N-terminal cleavage/methylation domain-containing protein
MSGTRSAVKAPLAGAFLFLGRRARGASLIELIAVIVILGVLSAVAVPRFVDETYTERGYAEEVAQAVRYARNVAVASGCEVQFSINGLGYSALQRGPGASNHCQLAGAFVTPVRRMDSELLAGTPRPSLGAVPAAASQFVFDTQGAIGGAGVAIIIGASNIVVLPNGLVQGP